MSVAAIAVLTIAFLFLLFLSGWDWPCDGVRRFSGFALLVNVEAALNLVAVDVYSLFSSYSFTCIPLFVFMGQIAAHAGIAKRVYDSTYKFVDISPVDSHRNGCCGYLVQGRLRVGRCHNRHFRHCRAARNGPV